MMRLLFHLFVVICLNRQISCHIYLHSLGGSNNRLKENTAVRSNKHRLFDSQNNERGGYNHGIHKLNHWNLGTDQYAMKYFQSGKVGTTDLTFEWTNEHGCGANEYGRKTRCNFVLQFLCHNADDDVDAKHTLRNGEVSDIQQVDSPTITRGYHESVTSYAACAKRHRHEGLYHAQVNVGKYAKNTKQNPNGERYGYECPEERDYYPYWHPTEWKDIAVLVDDQKLCSWYQNTSFNERTYSQCVTSSGNSYKYGESANNKNDCEEKNGDWKGFSSYLELAKKYKTEKACLSNNDKHSDIKYAWGYPYDRKKIINEERIQEACFVKMPNLDCRTSGWTRVNHLGNDPNGTPLRYTWKIPYFPSGDEKQCIFRIRYNISAYGHDYNPDTPGYDGHKFEKNPDVNIGKGVNLKLSLNPKYLGRTFQDRSHVFLLATRPNEIKDDVRIVNLNIRGKRGNIVQTFPAVEYDFFPNCMKINPDSYVHIQWTGSNTHNNNAPGGDGQTGDAGEGTGGTDRSNIVELDDPSKNIPVPYGSSKMFRGSTVIWSSLGIYGSNEAQKIKNAAIQLASSGYYRCELNSECQGESVQSKAQMQAQLNNATPTFTGLVMKFSEGTYYYMCSRNNNFSNRSQKGHIVVGI